MTAPTGGPAERVRGGSAAAVSERGITLARLRRQLADDGNVVSMATLSYWRSGDRQPEGAQSLAIVEGIEDRLRLRRGHLSALLGPSARLGAVPPPRLPFDEERENRETEQTLAALRSSLRRLCGISRPR